MTEKFEFIDAEYAVYQESDDEHVPSIVKLCRWLDVSRYRILRIAERTGICDGEKAHGTRARHQEVI